MAGSDKLNVFVSSTMGELRDVRDIVYSELREKSIDAFVYEVNAGAGPGSVSEAYLSRLNEADIYLGLFWKAYGEGTIAEYEAACDLKKPCFIYIRGEDPEREPKLNEFLRKCVYDAGVRYASFTSAVEVGRKAANDIMAWLVRQHRQTKTMREDENMSYEDARLELDKALQKIEKTVDASRRKKLLVTQREWEKFCAANAEFMADEARGGTMARVIRINTMVNMIKARTTELRKNLER